MAEPKQDGDIRGRWSWVEPAVWSERMLATLETGILRLGVLSSIAR